MIQETYCTYDTAQLIARFDTPDAEYNRILAQDLCDKLNERPV